MGALFGHTAVRSWGHAHLYAIREHEALGVGASLSCFVSFSRLNVGWFVYRRWGCQTQRVGEAGWDGRIAPF